MAKEPIAAEDLPVPPKDFPEDEDEKKKKKKEKTIVEELFEEDEDEEEVEEEPGKDELDELYEQSKCSEEDIYATEEFERYDDGVAD